MSMTEAQLVDEAMQSPPDARAEIASKLLAGQEETQEADVAFAWQEEIKRRLDDLRTGTAATYSWEAVKKRVGKAIHAARKIS